MACFIKNKSLLTMLALAAGLGGCSAPHYFDAFLLENVNNKSLEGRGDDSDKNKIADSQNQKFSCEEVDKKSDDKSCGNTYVPVFLREGHTNGVIPYTFSSNPIYVSKDAKVSLNITEIHPGWLHAGKEWELPDIDQRKWKRSQTHHIMGKELWLLVDARTIDAKDPLMTHSTRSFSATNVKMDGQSFGLVPVSDKESIISLDGENSYQVTFRLYEVDGLTWKMALARAVDKAGGLSDVLESAMATVGNLALSLGGSTIQTAVQGVLTDSLGEEMLFERLLLAAGAEKEMHGQVLILASDTELPNVEDKACADTKADTKNCAIMRRDYLLYDYVKSKKVQEELCKYQYPYNGEGGISHEYNDLGEYWGMRNAFLHGLKLTINQNDGTRITEPYAKGGASEINCTSELFDRHEHATYLRFHVVETKDADTETTTETVVAK